MAEGDISVGRRLAQIGVLGWIIVTPILIGIFAGRYLDARFASGLFWTAPLLMLGVALAVGRPGNGCRAHDAARLASSALGGGRERRAHFAVGLALGRLYFHGLWRTRAPRRRRRHGGDVALMIARFGLLGALLTLASLEGAAPLLALTLGVLIARRAVMRGVGEARS